MSVQLYTLQASNLAEQEIKKSRFVAMAAPCADEAQAIALLRQMAKQNAQAHHLAFAYRLAGTTHLRERLHDAGEPSGTAGRPLLTLLQAGDWVNVLLAVARTYGGIKLGTGGLVRAYSGTAKQALASAVAVPFVPMVTQQIVVSYEQFHALQIQLPRIGGSMMEPVFGAEIRVQVQGPSAALQDLLERLNLR